MRRTNLFPVVEFLVVVIMADGAGIERGVHRFELRPAMLRVADGAGDASFTMRLRLRRHETLGLVTGSAVTFHPRAILAADTDSMTGRA